MELKQVEKYANDKLAEYGLTKLGWTFKWDRSKRRFGQCRYRLKEVGISKPLAELNDADNVHDTVLHEIAHVLASVRGFVREGHGQNWKDICVEIGAKPVRCYSADQVVLPKMKYTGTCPKCLTTFQKARMPKHKRYHSKCNSRGHYDYVIEWVKS